MTGIALICPRSRHSYCADVVRAQFIAAALALRAEILAKTRAYFEAAYEERAFDAGVSPVPDSGRVFDASELVSLVDSSLDFWLTTGRFAERFEREFDTGLGYANACS